MPQKNVMIVESPNKIKTLKKILDSGWEVTASAGHVRDLPQHEFGVDPETLMPKYEFIPGKSFKGKKYPGGRERVNKISQTIRQASGTVYLATDPDREGEAIAWHLMQALKLKKGQYRRVAFDSLDSQTVMQALRESRDIDLNLVRAQEARRVLDRLVGYTVSPVLCRMASDKLSAGRVQSPALRFVVLRERAIRNFRPTDHFGVRITLPGEKGEWFALWDTSPYVSEDSPYVTDRSIAENAAGVKEVLVRDVSRKKAMEKPPAPLTTSALLQLASKRLRMGADTIAKASQRLFEEGLISYHRTDSTALSEETLSKLMGYAKSQGFSVVQHKFKGGGANAQEAHEAIHPKDMNITDVSEQFGAGSAEAKLYRLIHTHTLACVLPAAQYNVVRIVLEGVSPDGKVETFIARSRVMTEPGWRVTQGKEATEDKKNADEDDSGVIPSGIAANMSYPVVQSDIQEKQTKPPARYTLATLIKQMEKQGIGRPSTYAPTVTLLLNRKYVVEDKKHQFSPTEKGEKIIDILEEYNQSFVFPEYTSRMEEALDKIAAGETTYQSVMQKYAKEIESELKHFGMKNATIRELSENTRTRTENPQPDKDSLDEHGKPYPCPECQKGYMRRIKGKNGYFWGCSEYRSGCKCTASDKNGKPCFEQKKEEYPTDKFGKPYPCQKCGQPLRRISKKDGTYFWGCSNYSNGCRFTAADNDGEPTFKKNLKRTSEDAPKFRMD